eukprot:3671117-Prymnesium_polylepis.1
MNFIPAFERAMAWADFEKSRGLMADGRSSTRGLLPTPLRLSSRGFPHDTHGGPQQQQHRPPLALPAAGRPRGRRHAKLVSRLRVRAARHKQAGGRQPPGVRRDVERGVLVVVAR